MNGRKARAARVRQEQAPNIINVQSAETIAKYPDFNAAESLGRLPGISLSSDTGEGLFINIRGIDGNLDGATFGGVPLLNTFPGGTYFSGGGRAVEFDTIPTGAIDTLQREVRHEPRRALDGGKDGLDLVRKLITQSAGRTRCLLLELGDGQAQETKTLCLQAGYALIGILPDFTQRERVLVAEQQNDNG